MGRRKKTQRVWFALVDAKNASDELFPQVIDIPLGGDIVDFKRIRFAGHKDAYVADTPLMEDTMIKQYGGSLKNAVV
ncbi:unnamed protein product, partial [Aphanomyces euteiches]